MPEPERTRTAVPPEPMVPAVWWAMDITKFHPWFRDVFVAVFMAPSVWILCSCRNRTSAGDRGKQFSTAEPQEFGFQVSKAHLPFLGHQRSSFTEAVASKFSAGVMAQASSWILGCSEIVVGSSRIAVCLLVGFFFLLPFGFLALLARLGGLRAACGCVNCALQAAMGIWKAMEITTRRIAGLLLGAGAER